MLARAGSRRPEGAVLGPGTLLLRYIDADFGDRLLVVNLECDLDFTPVREPLIAPPAQSKWRLAWTSEAPEYGGQGMPPVEIDGPGIIPGGCAMLFVAEHVDDGSDETH